MTLLVFEVRGVYLFRTDADVPRALSAHRNATEDRYEVPERERLDELPMDWALVDAADRYRVRFRGEPPASVREDALLVEDEPGATVVLCPTEAAVEAACSAGGVRVG